MNSSNGWHWYGTKKVCVVDLRLRVFKWVPALCCRWRGLIEPGWADKQLTWSTSLTGHPQLHGVVTLLLQTSCIAEKKKNTLCIFKYWSVCVEASVLAWACVSVFVRLQIFSAKYPVLLEKLFFYVGSRLLKVYRSLFFPLTVERVSMSSCVFPFQTPKERRERERTGIWWEAEIIRRVILQSKMTLSKDGWVNVIHHSFLRPTAFFPLSLLHSCMIAHPRARIQSLTKTFHTAASIYIATML